MRLLSLVCFATCLPLWALAEGGTADLQRWPIHQDGRAGFMDRTGKVVIPAAYDDVSTFHEGLARVKVGMRETSYGAIAGGKNGYIDATGRLVIPATFDYARNFSDGRAAVKVGKRRFYIDTTGAEVIPGPFQRTTDFKEGLAGVELRKDQWAFIDRDGKIVFHLPPAADNRDPASFSEGYAVVAFKRSKQDRGSWVFDKAGNTVLEIPHVIARDVREGVIAVRDHTKKRWGFMDLSGKWVLPARYKFAWGFRQGRAQVTLEDGRRVFIDKRGKILLAVEAEQVGLFWEGMARIEQNDKVGYINEQGEVVIPADRWLAPRDALSQFTGGLAMVRSEGKGGEILQGYIDRAGTVVWAPTPTKWRPGKPLPAKPEAVRPVRP